MLETGITPDFIVVDGAEGGTGAAPLEFTDHVGTPLQEGLLLVHNTLRRASGLRERIQHRLRRQDRQRLRHRARLMALGADWCNSARGFMFALGCIQAPDLPHRPLPHRRGHAGPAAPARRWWCRDKAERVYHFHQQTLHALQELVQAAGLQHPREITAAPHRAPHAATTGLRSLAQLILTQLPEGATAAPEPGRVVEGVHPALASSRREQLQPPDGLITRQQQRPDAAPPAAAAAWPAEAPVHPC
jgi:hypothetical protein